MFESRDKMHWNEVNFIIFFCLATGAAVVLQRDNRSMCWIWWDASIGLYSLHQYGTEQVLYLMLRHGWFTLCYGMAGLLYVTVWQVCFMLWHVWFTWCYSMAGLLYVIIWQVCFMYWYGWFTLCYGMASILYVMV